MNSTFLSRTTGRTAAHRCARFCGCASFLGLVALPVAALSAVVSEATETALRAAMANGGHIQFAVDGTITLAAQVQVDKDTLLDGAGRQVVISGGSVGRVFYVPSGVTLGLANLTIADGRSVEGAGLYNAGTVAATNCVFAGNRAVGPAITAVGQNGTSATGGAVHNTGNFFGIGCTFWANGAQGGAGGPGSDPSVAPPIPAGLAGAGQGGAIYNVGALSLASSLFLSNSAVGAAGSKGASGDYYVSPLSGATGGAPGGGAAGGALCNAGNSVLQNCTLARNEAYGGNGGAGGDKSGPAPYVTFGPPGGMGGFAVGAIYTTNRLLSLTNCTAAENLAFGGIGGSGGMGNFQGRGGEGGSAVGGLSIEPPAAAFVNCLFASNSGTGGRGGYGTLNGDKYNPIYGYAASGSGDGNLRGAIIDGGHNLSSDNSAVLTNTTSLVGTDPRLGVLGNHGGPTATCMLQPGSPAIDGADPASAPPFDQRGYPRTFGSAPDIGATEYWPVGPYLLIQRGGLDLFRVRVATGIAGQQCVLLASSNLLTWEPAATNTVGADGMAQFAQPFFKNRFYRAVVP